MTPSSHQSATCARRFRRQALRLPLLGAALLGTLGLGRIAHADTTPQPLPFTQDWSNTDLITARQDWSGVPGIIGYRGDNLTDAIGTNPQLILGDGSGTFVNVEANAASPTTAGPGGGGIYEFDSLADPVVAYQGSGTADAPHLVFTLDTTGNGNISVAYNLRDVDPQGSAAIQQVALQYRIGTTGDYIDVPSAYTANAAGAAGTATKVTPVAGLLPAEANNQAVVQVRVITANADGSDELIGVDDINITGTPIGGTDPTNPFISALGDPASVAQGGSTLLSATVTPGTNPTSSGIVVTGDLTQIGGSATQAFFDDGTNGDVTAGDNTFSFAATVPAATTPGSKTLPISVVDAQARTAATTISLQVTQVFAASTTVVISEFRSRGAAGAGDEFVEIYNLSNADVDISGYTLQYSSAGGSISTFATVAQGVALPAGAYYLFTATGGPLADQGDANFNAGTADTGGLAIFDAAGSRVDAVGFDTGTVFKEGTGLASLTTNDNNQSYERLPLTVNNQDTQNNVDDFMLTDSNPQSLKPAGNNLPPSLNNTSYTTTLGQPFSAQLAGVDPEGAALTYTVTQGTPPAGITLSSTGLLSGTPTAAGRSDFFVSVSDGPNTITAKIIIVVAAGPDGDAPVFSRNAVPRNATRDEFAAFTLVGEVRDVAPAGVTPVGVESVYVQLRRNSDGFAYNGTAFTSNNSLYYPSTLGASSDGTTAGARTFSRSFSFLPAQLEPGIYSLIIAPKDVAGNFRVEIIGVNIVAAPPAGTTPPMGSPIRSIKIS